MVTRGAVCGFAFSGTPWASSEQRGSAFKWRVCSDRSDSSSSTRNWASRVTGLFNLDSSSSSSSSSHSSSTPPEGEGVYRHLHRDMRAVLTDAEGRARLPSCAPVVDIPARIVTLPSGATEPFWEALEPLPQKATVEQLQELSIQ